MFQMLTKESPIVKILSFGTDRSEQAMQTKIKLFVQKQCDQGLHYLTFHKQRLKCFW